MISLFYFFAYIFEAFISWMYFSKKFEYRIKKRFVLLSFGVSTLLQYSLSFIGIPRVNLIAFFVCNFLLCLICFKTRFLQQFFNVIFLSAVMLITELIIMYLSVWAFGIGLGEYATNELAMIIQASSGKALYFLFAYIFAVLSAKEKNKKYVKSKSIFLLLLPIVSIVLLLCIVTLTEKYSIPDNMYFVLMIATILLLYSNFVVFWVHESVIKSQRENFELKLQTQKSEIDNEYYKVLQSHYDDTNIVIHDIKRHLITIKDFADAGDNQRIKDYIDNLYGEYQIKHLKKYSENKLINVIVNRFVNTAKEAGVDFNCDIRNVDFSKIPDSGLTTILDNLLENAIEASKTSSEKFVELSIKESNENFIVISVRNSCASRPEYKDGEIVTSKKNKDIHGFGIKSVSRVAKSLGGSVNNTFDENKMIFTFNVIVRI